MMVSGSWSWAEDPWYIQDCCPKVSRGLQLLPCVAVERQKRHCRRMKKTLPLGQEPFPSKSAREQGLPRVLSPVLFLFLSVSPSCTSPAQSCSCLCHPAVPAHRPVLFLSVTQLYQPTAQSCSCLCHSAVPAHRPVLFLSESPSCTSPAQSCLCHPAVPAQPSPVPVCVTQL